MPSISFPYTIPDEAVNFIEGQFHRFGIQLPSPRIINETGELVISYVYQHKFYPGTPADAAHRFNNPGLSEPEKHQILGPLEYKIRIERAMYCDIRVLELSAWAALLWCWSEDGVKYVSWFHDAQSVVEEAKVAFR